MLKAYPKTLLKNLLKKNYSKFLNLKTPKYVEVEVPINKMKNLF